MYNWPSSIGTPREEVERLRKDNERQQKLIHSVMIRDSESGETKAAPGASETLLQSEIIRLTSDNMVRTRGYTYTDGSICFT